MIITIARQCGSGGHEIGKELASRLGLELYDRKRLTILTQQPSFSMQIKTAVSNVSWNATRYQKKKLPKW